MVIFDAAAPPTSPDVWRTSSRLAAVPTLELGPLDHLVVVAAHPDDETLGVGSLIHRLAAAGTAVHLVVVTDGAASHPHSTTVDAAALTVIRAEETDAALSRLASGAVVHRIGLPDGGIREHREAARAGIAAVLDALPGRALVLATWRGDGHRDHRVVGEVCAEVCTASGRPLLEYPVWLWHWATPDSAEVPWSRLRRLRRDAEDEHAKAAAIEAYASQIAPLSSAAGDEAVLRPELLEHFRRADEVVIVGDEREQYFDELYARHEDPWGYDSRWYERRKRALTVAALRRPRYARTLELGCSTGALTAELAARSDQMVGVDAAHAAIDRARSRLQRSAHVTLVEADVRDGIPPGRFDLVVLSEVGYYLEAAELRELLTAVTRALTDRGELLLCHWRHASSAFRQSAEQVHAAAQALGLQRQVHHEEPDLLLDLYSVDASSVARLEGLA